MRRQVWIGTSVVVLLAGGRGLRAASVLGVTPGLLPQAPGPRRRLAPLRGRPAALVAPALFPPLRCARRLLPQAAPQSLLAPLPVLLHLGTARKPRFSKELPAGKQGSALDVRGEGQLF
jgi:hypothetical protein